MKVRLDAADAGPAPSLFGYFLQGTCNRLLASKTSPRSAAAPFTKYIDL